MTNKNLSAIIAQYPHFSLEIKNETNVSNYFILKLESKCACNFFFLNKHRFSEFVFGN